MTQLKEFIQKVQGGEVRVRAGDSDKGEVYSELKTLSLEDTEEIALEAYYSGCFGELEGNDLSLEEMEALVIKEIQEMKGGKK